MSSSNSHISDPAKFIFGLYHVPYAEVPRRMNMAHRSGITRFDTAQLYGNESLCAESSNSDDMITTKLYAANTTDQTYKLIKRSLTRFGSKRINTMLLHRPMPNECWNALTSRADQFDTIGVSNYDINGLQILLDYCETKQIRQPDVHQIEVHPFVDCDPMIQFCRQHNIQVQGHTVLAQCKFLNYGPLVHMAQKYAVTPAKILVSWAYAKPIGVCVSTGS